MLVDQLRDRHLLLILDTCEHLLGACAALVAALLPPCPKMQVLATSREPLRVPGETTVTVRPLRLADAVELFGRRAAQAGTQIRPVRLFSTFIRSSMRQSSLYVVDPGYAVD